MAVVVVALLLLPGLSPGGTATAHRATAARPVAATPSVVPSAAAGAGGFSLPPPSAWQMPRSVGDPASRPSAGPGISVPSVEGTLFPQNDSLVQGNFQPWTLAYPLGIAYEGAGGQVALAGAISGTVGTYDPSNGTPTVQSPELGTTLGWPQGVLPQLGAMAYDAGTGRLYVLVPSWGVLTLAAGNDSYLNMTFFSALGTSALAAVALDPTLPYLFVADAANDSVGVMNTLTGALVKNISVGVHPDALVVDPATGILYVANAGSASVMAINVTSLAVQRTFPVGFDPVALTVVSATDSIWVLNRRSNNITSIDGVAFLESTVAVLPVGTNGVATSFVYDAGRQLVYVLNAPGGDVTPFNATSADQLGSVSVGGVPYAGVYDPSRNQIDLANTGRNTLDVVDDGSGALLHSYVLGAAPGASLYVATTGLVYLADMSVDWLYELSAQTDGVVGKIALPSPGIDLAYDPTTTTLAVLELDSNVSFIGTGTETIVNTWGPDNASVLGRIVYGNGEFLVSATVPTNISAPAQLYVVSAATLTESTFVGIFGEGAGQLAYDAANRDVYYPGGATLSAVSTVTNTVSHVWNLPSGDFAGTLALDNVSDQLYLFGDFSLDVFNATTSTFGGSLAGVFFPTSALFVWATNSVYVADQLTLAVTVIPAGVTPVFAGNISVGWGPWGLAYSDLSGLLYVGNTGSAAVSLVPLTTIPSQALYVSFSVQPASITLGQSIAVSTIASYPMWVDNFSYSGLPSGCPNQNRSSFTCTPNAPGSFTVHVTVRNPYGQSATSSSASLAVLQPLVLVGFVVTPRSLTLSTPVHLSVQYAGGAAPITVGYPSLPPGCSASTSTNWSCTPSSTGTFNVSVVVSDSAGSTEGANTTVTVHAKPAVSLELSTNVTQIGLPISLYANVTGGTGPFAFSYLGLPTGCATENTSLLLCTPTVSAAYPIVVKVTDASGVTATATAQLIVQAPASTPAPTIGGLAITTVYLLLGFLVVVVLIVVVALVLRRRGGGGGSAAPMPPPAAPPPAVAAAASPAPAEAPESYVVQPPAAPAEPAAPAPPPAYLRREPPAPARFHVDDTAPASPPPPAAPAAGGGRPPLVCAHCGTVNEPWITVCRKCRRTLFSTGVR